MEKEHKNILKISLAIICVLLIIGCTQAPPMKSVELYKGISAKIPAEWERSQQKNVSAIIFSDSQFTGKDPNANAVSFDFYYFTPETAAMVNYNGVRGRADVLEINKTSELGHVSVSKNGGRSVTRFFDVAGASIRVTIRTAPNARMNPLVYDAIYGSINVSPEVERVSLFFPKVPQEKKHVLASYYDGLDEYYRTNGYVWNESTVQMQEFIKKQMDAFSREFTLEEMQTYGVNVIYNDVLNASFNETILRGE